MKGTNLDLIHSYLGQFLYLDCEIFLHLFGILSTLLIVMSKKTTQTKPILTKIFQS